MTFVAVLGPERNQLLASGPRRDLARYDVETIRRDTGSRGVRVCPIAEDQLAWGLLEDNNLKLKVLEIAHKITSPSGPALCCSRRAAVLLYLVERKTPLGRWARGLLARAHKNDVVVALANKLARIAWAILAHGGAYDAGWELAAA